VLTVHEVAADHWTGNPMILEADPSDMEKARQAAQDMVARVTAQLGDAVPTSVHVHAASGFASQELIDASKDSDLLVIGSRGGGGFARLMLGSVSSQVVHHAACPVVVVPTGR
jgi:nucleotide-binding universal stress UspA family protein